MGQVAIVISAVVSAASAAFIAVLTFFLVRATKAYTRETTTYVRLVQEQLNLLRAQVENQRAVGRMIVANVIQSASLKTKYWKNAKIANLAVTYRLPQTFGLVPDQAGSALEHASQISKEGAARLRNAFDFLMFAQIELEILRDAKQTCGDFYDKYVKSVMDWLDRAEEEIELATNEFKKHWEGQGASVC